MIKYYRENGSKALKHYIGSLLSVFFQEKIILIFLKLNVKSIFVKDFFLFLQKSNPRGQSIYNTEDLFGVNCILEQLELKLEKRLFLMHSMHLFQEDLGRLDAPESRKNILKKGKTVSHLYGWRTELQKVSCENVCRFRISTHFFLFFHTYGLIRKPNMITICSLLPVFSCGR